MLEERRRIGVVGKQRTNRIRRRKRVQIQQFDRVGIQATAGNHVEIAAGEGEIEPGRRRTATAERIANVHTGRNLARGRGVENRAGRHGAAKSIGFGSGLSLDEVLEVGVTAAALRLAGNGPSKNRALHAAKTFVVSEEKHFVEAAEQLRDDDRATGGEAELVLAEFALRNRVSVLEEVRGVEFVVAEKFH